MIRGSPQMPESETAIIKPEVACLVWASNLCYLMIQEQ
jgi:hypothetical protein